MNREKNSFTQQRFIELLLSASSVTGTGVTVPVLGQLPARPQGKAETTAAGKCCGFHPVPVLILGLLMSGGTEQAGDPGRSARTA